MKNRVRIIAPAGAPVGGYEAGMEKLEQMKAFLSANGFEVSVQENIFANPPVPMYANTKEIRLAGLRAALLAEDVDIIWAFRGGSGCGAIAQNCMDIKPVGTKILIGFSDLTVLHALFNQHYGLASIHGPVLTTLLGKPQAVIEEIKSAINEEEQKLQLFPVLSPKNKAAQNSGKIEAVVTGGNLTVFNSLIGTKLHPITNGKILLLEDTGEPGYKVARSLDHLENAALVKDLAACIFGDFIGEDKDGTVSYSIQQFADNYPELPIFRARGIGHGDVNHCVVMGNCATIEDGILSCKLV